jgi:uncharacterized membrane protein YfcA
MGAVFLCRYLVKIWEYLTMEIGLILTALLSGAFIGAVLGFIGAGGAMVSVPILLYLFDFTPVAATTAALAVVFLAAVAQNLRVNMYW